MRLSKAWAPVGRFWLVLVFAPRTPLRDDRTRGAQRVIVPENSVGVADADPLRFPFGDLAGAAVAILETYHHSQQGGDELVPAFAPEAATVGSDVQDRKVRGLARMVQVSPETTVVDLTVRGVAPGEYAASIREYGDLKHGATSAGPVWLGSSSTAQPRGLLGTLQVGKDGRGSVFLDHPFQIWEVIGHAMVISSQQEEEGSRSSLQNDENTIVGVIARSAGVWDNDKTVCSCTGKTLWEERKDEVQKGMI